MISVIITQSESFFTQKSVIYTQFCDSKMSVHVWVTCDHLQEWATDGMTQTGFPQVVTKLQMIYIAFAR